jgi:superfamily II DNA or RNA helicase
MFLGPVLFKGERDEKREVVVRAIEYQVDDDEFNHVVTDFRGNPAFSTMITKLCDYNRRTEFILRVLADMLKENPKQQIMMLAHNKSLLKYLHDAIEHRGLGSVGYYVGGMKEAALKKTETKQIVIATYSMASEALDIKTLTTLFMCTPRSDIQQSVGRILREKHSEPVVVDIIDSHDLFKNQWKKRKAFYKKENYKILYTTSVNYAPDTNKWTTVFQPGANHCTSKPEKSKLLLNIKTKKTTSSRSTSSITDDSSDEEEVIETIDVKNKNDLLCGKCLIKIKK